MTADPAGPPTPQSLDFFISYSPVDERWATWLAATLEAAGFRTMLQAWDFVAGSRFIELMDRGVSQSTVILAVLSRHYLRSRYGRMEWQAALRAAPENPETKLITVRVEDIDITGLLAQITYVDLVGVKDAEQARELVLRRVRDTLAGRARPTDDPGYPGVDPVPIPQPAAPERSARPVTRPAPRRLPTLAPRYPATPSVAAPSRPGVVVLHVAGPRFGDALAGASHQDGADGLHARIFGDVTRLIHDGAPAPDLLVVSGDLAAAGGRRQFEAAQDAFSRLRVRLGLEPDRLIVVPGPGDVNKAACSGYFSDCEADDETPSPPYWPKWRHFTWLFREFYQGLDHVVFECGQPWTLFTLPELRVVVAGINSTMAVSHRAEDQFGAVQHEQAAWFAQRLHEFEDADWLRIGVMHHAPDGPGGLRDADTFDRLVAPRLNVLLHAPAATPDDADGGAPAPTRLAPARPGEAELVEFTPDGLIRWSGRGGPGERLNRPWRRASVTFSPVPAEPVAETRPVSDPTDQLLDRIEEVCRARHERVRIRRVQAGRPYLIVTYNDGGVVREVGVAAHPGTPDTTDIDAFRQLARSADPSFSFEVVYQGEPPPRELREAARQDGIRLRSFLEFQGLIDLRPYVAAQSARLAADRQYPPELYVPQRYTEPDRIEQPVGVDLVGELMAQIGGDHGRFILVLGDFGRGKSFALRQLALRMPVELPHLTPILIELRALDKSHSLLGLVAAHLADHGEHSIDLRAFQYMLRQGRIVLLFDGFDELVTRTTYSRAADHLDTLLAAAVDDAKIIVTSRTQHFRSRAQVFTKLGERVDLLPQRRVLNIEEFTPAQIRAYLVNHFRGDEGRAEERLRLINGVANLIELSHNPRMLGFVAGLEPERLLAVARVGAAISPAGLYREILSAWLGFEERRTRDIPGTPAGLSAPELWRAVTTLALRLWEANESVLQLSDLAEVADTLTGLATGTLSLDETTHAIGTGTLLVRTDDGLFGFIHDSVVEWLVANEIANRLAGGSSTLLSRRPLSQLTVEFLCDLAEARVCEEWAAGVQGDPHADAVTRRNAGRVSSRLRVPAYADLRGAALQNEDLSYRDFAEVDLTGADLTDARLVGANLTGAILRDATLVGTRLDNAVLTGADLTGADLSRARLTRADLRGVTVTGSRWRRAALISATTDDGLTGRPELAGAAIAPGMPVEPQLTPAAIGVPYGFHIQFGRLPLPLAYGADGGTLAIACDNGSVLVCDSLTGAPVRSLDCHRGRVYAVLTTADDTLITAGADHAIRCWSASTGEQRWSGDGYQGWVWPVVLNERAGLVGVSDSTGRVSILDLATGATRIELDGTLAPVWTAAFSPAGDRFVCGGSDHRVRVWDLTTGALTAELGGHGGVRREQPLADHGGAVYRVVYDPAGRFIATGDEIGTVRLWDAASGELLRQLHGHTRSVFAIDFHPNGRLLATADSAGVVRLWTVPDGAPAGHRQAHPHAVYQILFSPDGTLAATCDSGGGAQLWTVDPAGRALTPLAELLGHRAAVWPGRFRPDGRQFATASNDGTVRLWDTATGACRQTLRGHGRRITSVSFNPDGSRLAASGNDGTVRLWDPATGRQVNVLTGIIDQLVSAVFSPVRNTIAAASNDGGVYMLDADTGQPDRELDVETENVWAEAFSPDGRILATANDDDTVRLWYHHTGAQGHTLAEHRGRVRSIAFDPAGTTLATGCDDSAVRLWGVESGACAATLRGHTDRVYSVSFGAAGRRLASASWDGSVKVWDVGTGGCLRTLADGAGRFWATAFHPGGRLLVGAGDDALVHVWDARDGRHLAALRGHTDRIFSVAFDPTGDRLASGADDGTIRLWGFTDPERPRPLATLVGQAEGWVALGPDGRYKRDGAVTGEFWHAVGGCRFEPGELDGHLGTVRRVAAEAPW